MWRARCISHGWGAMPSCRNLETRRGAFVACCTACMPEEDVMMLMLRLRLRLRQGLRLGESRVGMESVDGGCGWLGGEYCEYRRNTYITYTMATTV